MKVLLNYASRNYIPSQKKNTGTGLEVGGFDSAISYGPSDLPKEFRQRNRHILRQRRGNGFWLWKFYFIHKSLEQLDDGDFLFYCDSGSVFMAPIDPLIELSRSLKQDIIPFEHDTIESHYTKRDAFKIMKADTPAYRDTFQRMSGFMLIRKSKFSQDFMHEILALGQDERLITDLKNQLKFPNYPGFIEHRHDQSIWSLMTKKHGLKAFRDPSQYGNQFISSRADSPYDQLIKLTRLTELGKCQRYYQEYARDGLSLFVRNKIRNVLQRKLPERER